MGDDENMMKHHKQLTESVEDKLSLAALHYQKGHSQEAAEIYKALLLENRDSTAFQGTSV